MMKQINYFLFDLDNTLYHPENGPLLYVDSLMTKYIADLFQIEKKEAKTIRKNYYNQYGTTLSGLMNEHHIDPENFLEKVHDIPQEALPPFDPELKEILNEIPQPKYVLTNSYKPYAEKVLSSLQIRDCFEDIFDIVFMDLKNKYDPASYQKAMKTVKPESKPEEFVMFDDIWKYLESAQDLGIKTILVNPEKTGRPDHHIKNIDGLKSILQLF